MKNFLEKTLEVVYRDGFVVALVKKRNILNKIFCFFVLNKKQNIQDGKSVFKI